MFCYSRLRPTKMTKSTKKGSSLLRKPTCPNRAELRLGAESPLTTTRNHQVNEEPLLQMLHLVGVIALHSTYQIFSQRFVASSYAKHSAWGVFSRPTKGKAVMMNLNSELKPRNQKQSNERYETWEVSRQEAGLALTFCHITSPSQK